MLAHANPVRIVLSTGLCAAVHLLDVEFAATAGEVPQMGRVISPTCLTRT